MKKLISILVISSLTFFNCQKKNNSATELRQKIFDKENELVQIIQYYERKPNTEYKITFKLKEYDSVVYKYDNGQIFKTGKQLKNGKPFDIWKLYSKSGKIREIREWFIIRGHSRLNRAWFLGKNGDTIHWRSEDSIFNQKEFINDTIEERATSFDIFFFQKDTLELNEPLRAYAYCRSPLLENKNSQTAVLIATSKTNFNSDFSNEKEVELDTFYNLTIDKENRKWFKGVKPQYFTTFGYYFDNPGEKILKGYMLEYATGNFENGADSLTSKKYFQKRIYVKDTLEE